MSSDAPPTDPVATSTPPPAKSKHTASCHCEAVRFTVNVPPIAHSDNGTCDCSHCTKRGIIWGFCAKEDLVLEQGREHLKEYEFGAKSFKHLFCDVCSTLIAGGKSAKDFPTGDEIGYNVRCVRDIDIHQISTTQYSGIDRQPPYVPALPVKHTFEPEEGKVVLTGSCHCGQIKLAVQTRSLEKAEGSGESVEVVDCNCTMCGGNGLLWIYPTDAEYQLSPTPGHSPSAYSIYTFAPESPSQNKFYSCSTCGCGVFMRREMTSRGPRIGVNLRLVDEPKLDHGKLDIEKWNGRDWVIKPL